MRLYPCLHVSACTHARHAAFVCVRACESCMDVDVVFNKLMYGY
jgi:hypothetical protein